MFTANRELRDFFPKETEADVDDEVGGGRHNTHTHTRTLNLSSLGAGATQHDARGPLPADLHSRRIKQGGGGRVEGGVVCLGVCACVF